jgi:hypothetical protein
VYEVTPCPSLPRRTSRPNPAQTFPLFPHRNGWWANKVRGRLWHFGKVVDDLDGQRAVEKSLDEKSMCQPAGLREAARVPPQVPTCATSF